MLFREMLNYIPIGRRLELVTTFMESINVLDVKDLIYKVFRILPPDWKRFIQLEERMIRFLKSSPRLTTIEEIAQREIVNLK